MRLAAPSYYGGKSPEGPRGTGRWIASVLPVREAYCEPFCGMAGVLLARARSMYECINDADGLIVDWWTAVRDHAEEFAHMVEHTPLSRKVYDDAKNELGHPDILKRALAVHVRLTQSLLVGLGADGWSSMLRRKPHNSAEMIKRLTVRLRYVVLENADACDVMERYAHRANAVVYCDPPYADTAVGPYRATVDRGRLGELLRAQKGFCAISGYGDEWDHLDWVRSVRGSFAHFGSAAASGRTEVLWTNYEAAGQLELIA